MPYETRAQIVSSGLGERSAVVAYVDDAAAAFFLHVQGSGRVTFANGEVVRVAYDGQNGHPYTAVGRVLVERGEIAREQLSMQNISAWLKANPGKAEALMNENPSYVFFKEQPLTAEASLAVDLRFHGLGAPMWVDGSAPADDAAAGDVAFRCLLVAQDTGGAIRGPVRGDVYWGSSARAEGIAGRMAHKGQLYVLLPKAVAARLR
jgi:membrane-bound lytic murein transglycosylase A